MNIGADAEILCLERGARAGPAAAAHLTESLFQNVFEAAEAAAPASPRGAGKALRTEIEVLVVRAGTKTAVARSRPGARAETFKAAETRFPFGIDLATIERFTLVLVAQQFVCGVQLGETGRSFGIVLVGVRMQFFCEPAIGVFDLARARLAIYAQDFVGIAHPFDNSALQFGPAPGPPRLATSMWE